MQRAKRGEEAERFKCDRQKRKRKGGKRNESKLWMSGREKRAVKCTDDAQRRRYTAERLGITTN